MKKRHAPSSVDMLPEPIRKQIGRLIASNHTLDDILEHLKQLETASEEPFAPPSRAALGRYAKNLRAAQERMARTRAMAEAFGTAFGEKPDDQVFRTNHEILQTIIMELLTAVEEDEETGEVRPVTLDPKQVQSLAKSMQSLAAAQKIEADRILTIQEKVCVAAAMEAKKAGEEAGLSATTIDDIYKRVLGVVRQ